MNDQLPPSTLDAQVEAMLQRVTRSRQERCDQMRAAVDSQAQEILRSGRAEARANVRRAVALERSRIAQGLRQAEASAELEARRRAQSETRRLLECMWTEIADALEARWRDPEHRRAWVEAALQQADLLLGERPSWRIEHGAGWSPEQRSALEKLASKRGARTTEWAYEPELRAGVRIRSEKVCLDATVQGLLAHRADIESAFLAEYLAAADKELPHE
jgi:vacuolar-type H+-ATPase subunit E/Vma4